MQQDRRYFTDQHDIEYLDCQMLRMKDSVLFRVDEMTYEDEAPRKEALENVLSATRIQGVNFVYLLVGRKDGVKFYYGVARDLSHQLGCNLEMPEIGTSALKASLLGNFRGSRVSEVTPEDKGQIFSRIEKMKYVSRIEGVAGSVKDDEAFQSVDRLVDIMQGEEFCLLIIAHALQPAEITDVEQGLYEAYSTLSPFIKINKQESESIGESTSKSLTEGTSENKSESASSNKGTSSSTSTGKNTSHSKTSGNSNQQGGESSGAQKGTSYSVQSGTSSSTGVSKSQSEQTGINKGTSKTFSREYQNKSAQEWIKYCDDVIFPRLDYGRGKGIFTSAFYVMSKSQIAQIKLENTVISLYSGEQGNRVPLRAFPLDPQDKQRKYALGFQIPAGKFKKDVSQKELLARSLLLQKPDIHNEFQLANWITTNELSMIAGLPRKEVIGMRLREEVEFGLNYQKPAKENGILLGNLVQNGNEVKTANVFLDKKCLDKHLFVAGVTGSGKTTTCHRILLESKLPFLVIEPAKTEYRILKNTQECRDLLIFTLGNDTVAPFRLNPFEFFPEESIVSHVDMMKASLEAAFDMEAAIPQLIEQALYKCYENKGWDISTNTNINYPGKMAFEPDTYAFPTFSDLLEVIPEVVKEQGFDMRLQNDYIGSIKARLQSLVLGSKGLMLDTKRSIDFDSLLDKKVVFELEGIKNGNEKALIMGFILSAFNEAVKERYLKKGTAHPHILLVEEAHRLLSKFSPGDSPNKKQGVEAFSDMLAEIRKYGECLIIVDQIPNKLTPDVLKNTSTKIVHRIFAQDDKDVIGNTMALSEDQRNFLSSLEIGRAIIFSDGFGQAMQVQIERITDTSHAPLQDSEIRLRVLQYYFQENQRAIMMPLKMDYTKLSPEKQFLVFNFLRADIPTRMLSDFRKKNEWSVDYAHQLETLLSENIIDEDIIANWMMKRFWEKNEESTELQAKLKSFIKAYLKGKKQASAIGNCFS